MIFAILGSLGGITAFVTAVVFMVRSIVRQVGATEDNTAALKDLKDSVRELKAELSGHETRISRLEGSEPRRQPRRQAP